MKQKKTLTLFILSLLLSILPVWTVHGKELHTPHCDTGYLWVGDSRFVGMDAVVKVSEKENNFVIAKTGQGLDWFKKEAIPKIEDIFEEYPEKEKWYLISNLGVNDLKNAEKYITCYDELVSCHEDMDLTLILVSVNPVDNGKARTYGYDGTWLSLNIPLFNDVLQNTDYTYIDTNTILTEKGFSTVDGIHYTDMTYELIYDTIQKELFSKKIRRSYEKIP